MGVSGCSSSELAEKNISDLGNVSSTLNNSQISNISENCTNLTQKANIICINGSGITGRIVGPGLPPKGWNGSDNLFNMSNLSRNNE
jgi:hypothetical protein